MKSKEEIREFFAQENNVTLLAEVLKQALTNGSVDVTKLSPEALEVYNKAKYLYE